MIYCEQDLADIINNFKYCPGITFISKTPVVRDINENLETLAWWRPCIGQFRGFAQLNLMGDETTVYQRASRRIWKRLARCVNTERELSFKVSLPNCHDWLNIRVVPDADIVEAFTLYDGYTEFVAVDEVHRILISVQTEQRSSYRDELYLYVFRYWRDEKNELIFIKK